MAIKEAINLEASNEKTLWIIGAGASKSHSRGIFPTADELLGHMLNRYLLNELPGGEAGLLSIREYFLRRLGTDIANSTVLPDLETVLGFMDTDLEVSPNPSLLLAREFLVKLVRSDLLALHREIRSGTGEYDTLASTLRPNDSLISFNWDVLLDDALGRRHLIADQPAYGRASKQYETFAQRYSGLSAGTWDNASPLAPISAATATDGIFLKLHGSVDWLVCVNESCSSKHLVYALTAEEALCGSCLERLQSVLVPPVVAKRVREWAILRRLWNRAVVEAGSASCIVLWGYSLPATDFYSRWLLSHVRTGNLTRLTIINPVISGRGDMVESRHASFIDSVRRTFGVTLKECEIDLWDSFANWHSRASAQYPSWHDSIVKCLRTV